MKRQFPNKISPLPQYIAGNIVYLLCTKRNETTMKKEELMRKAIELSIENVANGGGPFGAVIAKDGEIIATGVNRVTSQRSEEHTSELQSH